MAIARTEEFIREAEGLAAKFTDALQNEVYSSSTTHLLRKVLPREYSETVNDAISDVDSSDKDKLKAIKDFLETKKKSAILGIDPELEQYSRPRGNGSLWNNNSNYSSSDDNQHDCKKEKCNTAWNLLGCVELYKIQTAKLRKEMVYNLRGCYRCGAPFKKVDGKLHPCSWGNGKDATQ